MLEQGACVWIPTTRPLLAWRCNSTQSCQKSHGNLCSGNCYWLLCCSTCEDPSW